MQSKQRKPQEPYKKRRPARPPSSYIAPIKGAIITHMILAPLLPANRKMLLSNQSRPFLSNQSRLFFSNQIRPSLLNTARIFKKNVNNRNIRFGNVR